MFQTPHGRWAVLAVLLLPSMAKGAEVQVGYLVARTPMAQTVANGKRVTFTLHSDAECSGPAVRTVVIQLKDAAIHDVMREGAMRSGRNRPNAFRLVATFPDVDPDAAPFVQVTGPGIVPAGVGCQLWHRAGLGTIHTTAAELREQMVPAGAVRAKPPGTAATPGP